MNNKENNHQDEHKHASAGEELRHEIMQKAKELWQWYLPKKDLPITKQILFTILKTPILLMILLFSPIAGIILLFTFFAAF